MAQVNFNAVKQTSDKNLVCGLPNIGNPTWLCEGCLVGKQTQKSYPTQASFKAKQRLDLVHEDLYGPISPTPGGN